MACHDEPLEQLPVEGLAVKLRAEFLSVNFGELTVIVDEFLFRFHFALTFGTRPIVLSPRTAGPTINLYADHQAALSRQYPEIEG